MKKLPSSISEHRALTKLMNSPEFKAFRAQEEAERTDFSNLPTTSVFNPTISWVTCLIYRGKGRLISDNVIGKCHDCGVPIQYRPYTPSHLLKLCSFCSLRRLTIEPESDSRSPITPKP